MRPRKELRYSEGDLKPMETNPIVDRCSQDCGLWFVWLTRSRVTRSESPYTGCSVISFNFSIVNIAWKRWPKVAAFRYGVTYPTF